MNNQSEQERTADGLNPTIPDPIEQLYIESSVIGLVEFRKRIESLITRHTEQAVLEARKSLLDMLDRLGVEKCHVCKEHLLDADMYICESCDYGVHEWCTGYTYDGDGEYPAESAYAICKACYKPEAQLNKLKGEN